MLKILKMEMNNPKCNKIIELNEDKSVVYILNGEKKDITIDEKVYNYIIYYLKYINKISISGWDKYTKIYYDGLFYNKGLAFYDIEHMILKNKCLDEILQNDPMTIYRKQQQKLKEDKEKEAYLKKTEWKKREENAPKIDTNDLKLETDNIRKKIPSINFSLEATNDIKLGETCFFTNFIDIADDVNYPKDMILLAQIRLSDFSKYDLEKKLPSEGYLYFFQAPIVEGNFYEVGKVIYSKNENVVRKRLDCYNEDFTNFSIACNVKCITESIDDYREYNNSFNASVNDMSKFNKIFGVYCSYDTDRELAQKITNNYEILFQIGKDLYGEGITNFLIKPDDLENGNFNEVVYKYSQT